MKEFLFFLSLILSGFACTNSSNKAESTNAGQTKNSSPSSPNANSDDLIVGGWKRVAVGDDQNQNGSLDEAENRINDGILAGVDYLQFEANGKCVYDKDMKFEATYEVKMDKNNKAIFIYPSGLPAELSREERDKNALVFRITVLEPKKLVVKPAHLAGRMVEYQRI